jgi:hypothetical protein
MTACTEPTGESTHWRANWWSIRKRTLRWNGEPSGEPTGKSTGEPVWGTHWWANCRTNSRTTRRADVTTHVRVNRWANNRRVDRRANRTTDWWTIMGTDWLANRRVHGSFKGGAKRDNLLEEPTPRANLLESQPERPRVNQLARNEDKCEKIVEYERHLSNTQGKKYKAHLLL